MCGSPVPAARDESRRQANARQRHYGNVAARSICRLGSGAARRPNTGAQFGVSTGSDYGHIPACVQGERCPHPVDFVVDEA